MSWQNHTVDDEEAHAQQVQAVCQLYQQAQTLHEEHVHVISVDEKTGIQARQPVKPNRPMCTGQIEKVEHDYERNGTQVLTANFEVATGNVIAPMVSETCKEADFAAHIEQTIATDPTAEWVIICDQLNTHKPSSSWLLRFVESPMR